MRWIATLISALYMLLTASAAPAGLSAIAALSREWKGSVRIAPAQGQQGTCLQVRIPLARAA